MTALDDALREARQTTIGADQWLRRILDGYRGKPYNYAGTAWYKAIRALEQAAKATAPAPTPAPVPTPAPAPNALLVARARNVIVCTTDPETAIARAKPGYTVAFCADPNPSYRNHATAANVQAAKSRGIETAGWCGRLGMEHSGFDGPGARFTVELVAALGLDYGIGQAETFEEYLDCAHYGLDSIILGNPNALLDDPKRTSEGISQSLHHARQKCAAGEQVWIAENYWNVREGDRPDRYGIPQGIVEVSRCLGMYDAASEGGRYRTLAEYKQYVPAEAWPHIGLYVAGMNDDEWQVLP